MREVTSQKRYATQIKPSEREWLTIFQKHRIRRKQHCRSSTEQKEVFIFNRGVSGALGRSRTYDHLVRSQVLYPAELQAHIRSYNTTI